MEKELKIYKGGLGQYTIQRSTKVSPVELLIEFDKEYDLAKDDVLWAEDDRERNQTSNMIVVSSVDGKNIIAREVDGKLVDNIRDFQDGEIMTTIATFRENG